MLKVLLKYCKLLFESADLFGHRADLYVNKHVCIKSKFGGLISLLIIVLFMFLFISNFSSILNHESLSLILSQQSYTGNELLEQKKSFKFDFSYENFYFNLFLTARFENQTQMSQVELKRYLKQTVIYKNENGRMEEMELENCDKNKINDFLLFEKKDINNINNATTDTDTKAKVFCINRTITMGLIANYSSNTMTRPQISYSISKCVNSTKNNNSCATVKEIIDLLPRTVLQMSIPKTIYDFKNIAKPRKRIYDYKFFILDKKISNLYISNLMPIYLKTDYGWVQEEYDLDNIDFEEDKIEHNIFSFEPEDEKDLFTYIFLIGLNDQTYYRKNEKLQSMLSSLGGILNILFIFGKILCGKYNQMLYKHRLMNYSFDNLDKKIFNEKKKINESNSNNKFHFSILRYLLPDKLLEDSSYKNARKYIYEYLDIENIIKRFQDIDKLKMIILNKNQRMIFEILPKPGIFSRKNSQTKENEKFFNFESLHLAKNKRIIKEKLIDYKFLLTNDPINKRILEILGSNTEKEIFNSISNEIINFSYFYFLSYYIGESENLRSINPIDTETNGVVFFNPNRYTILRKNLY